MANAVSFGSGFAQAFLEASKAAQQRRYQQMLMDYRMAQWKREGYDPNTGTFHNPSQSIFDTGAGGNLPPGAHGGGGGDTGPVAPASAGGQNQGDFGKIKTALTGEESGGSYTIQGPDVGGGRGRAQGRYQIMPENIGPWTKKYLGTEMTPEQFRASPEAQDKTFEGRVMDRFQHFGNWRDVVSEWHSGLPYNEAVAKGRRDVNESTAQYTDHIMQRAGIGGTSDPVGTVAAQPPKAAAAIATSTGNGNDPYSNIAAKGAHGEDQRPMFQRWNNDPVGNDQKKLAELDPQMQKVIARARADNPDLKFVIGNGKRSAEDQDWAKSVGWSKVGSKDGGAAAIHMQGKAADLWGLDKNGKVQFDPNQQKQISQAIKTAAQKEGVNVNWGGDWKSFKDAPHFELKGAGSAEKAGPEGPPALHVSQAGKGDGSYQVAGLNDIALTPDEAAKANADLESHRFKGPEQPPDPLGDSVQQSPRDVRVFHPENIFQHGQGQSLGHMDVLPTPEVNRSPWQDAADPSEQVNQGPPGTSTDVTSGLPTGKPYIPYDPLTGKPTGIPVPTSMERPSTTPPTYDPRQGPGGPNPNDAPNRIAPIEPYTLKGGNYTDYPLSSSYSPGGGPPQQPAGPIDPSIIARQKIAANAPAPAAQPAVATTPAPSHGIPTVPGMTTITRPNIDVLQGGRNNPGQQTQMGVPDLSSLWRRPQAASGVAAAPAAPPPPPPPVSQPISFKENDVSGDMAAIDDTAFNQYKGGAVRPAIPRYATGGAVTRYASGGPTAAQLADPAWQNTKSTYTLPGYAPFTNQQVYDLQNKINSGPQPFLSPLAPTGNKDLTGFYGAYTAPAPTAPAPIHTQPNQVTNTTKLNTENQTNNNWLAPNTTQKDNQFTGNPINYTPTSNNSNTGPSGGTNYFGPNYNNAAFDQTTKGASGVGTTPTTTMLRRGGPAIPRYATGGAVTRYAGGGSTAGAVLQYPSAVTSAQEKAALNAALYGASAPYSQAQINAGSPTMTMGQMQAADLAAMTPDQQTWYKQQVALVNANTNANLAAKLSYTPPTGGFGGQTSTANQGQLMLSQGQQALTQSQFNPTMPVTPPTPAAIAAANTSQVNRPPNQITNTTKLNTQNETNNAWLAPNTKQDGNDFTGNPINYTPTGNNSNNDPNNTAGGTNYFGPNYNAASFGQTMKGANNVGGVGGGTGGGGNNYATPTTNMLASGGTVLGTPATIAQLTSPSYVGPTVSGGWVGTPYDQLAPNQQAWADQQRAAVAKISGTNPNDMAAQQALAGSFTMMPAAQAQAIPAAPAPIHTQPNQVTNTTKLNTENQTNNNWLAPNTKQSGNDFTGNPINYTPTSNNSNTGPSGGTNYFGPNYNAAAFDQTTKGASNVGATPTIPTTNMLAAGGGVWGNSRNMDDDQWTGGQWTGGQWAGGQGQGGQGGGWQGGQWQGGQGQGGGWGDGQGGQGWQGHRGRGDWNRGQWGTHGNDVSSPASPSNWLSDTTQWLDKFKGSGGPFANWQQGATDWLNNIKQNMPTNWQDPSNWQKDISQFTQNIPNWGQGVQDAMSNWQQGASQFGQDMQNWGGGQGAQGGMPNWANSMSNWEGGQGGQGGAAGGGHMPMLARGGSVMRYDGGGDVSAAAIGMPPGLGGGGGQQQSTPPIYYNPAVYAGAGAPINRGVSQNTIPSFAAMAVPTYQHGGSVMRYADGGGVDDDLTSQLESDTAPAPQAQQTPINVPSEEAYAPDVPAPDAQPVSNIRSGGGFGGGFAGGLQSGMAIPRGAGYAPRGSMKPAPDSIAPAEAGFEDRGPAEQTSPVDQNGDASSGLMDAIRGGLQHIFGQTQPGQTVPANSQVSDARREFVTGSGGADQREMIALGEHLDPSHSLDNGMRNMMGMKAVYDHYLLNNDMPHANQAAASMMIYASNMAAKYGDEAVKRFYKGDTQGGIDALKESYRYVPDGNNVDARQNPDGTFHVEQSNSAGKIKWQGDVAPQEILGAALGMQNRSLFWHTLQQQVTGDIGGAKTEAAATERQQIRRENDAAADESAARIGAAEQGGGGGGTQRAIPAQGTQPPFEVPPGPNPADTPGQIITADSGSNADLTKPTAPVTTASAAAPTTLPPKPAVGIPPQTSAPGGDMGAALAAQPAQPTPAPEAPTAPNAPAAPMQDVALQRVDAQEQQATQTETQRIAAKYQQMMPPEPDYSKLRPREIPVVRADYAAKTRPIIDEMHREMAEATQLRSQKFTALRTGIQQQFAIEQQQRGFTEQEKMKQQGEDATQGRLDQRELYDTEAKRIAVKTAEEHAARAPRPGAEKMFALGPDETGTVTGKAPQTYFEAAFGRMDDGSIDQARGATEYKRALPNWNQRSSLDSALVNGWRYTQNATPESIADGLRGYVTGAYHGDWSPVPEDGYGQRFAITFTRPSDGSMTTVVLPRDDMLNIVKMQQANEQATAMQKPVEGRPSSVGMPPRPVGPPPPTLDMGQMGP